MTLSQAPTSHPEKMTFVKHTILVLFLDHYIGAFEVVHVRVLGGALKKVEIPAAVENLIQLLSILKLNFILMKNQMELMLAHTEPGGYLQ